MGIFFFATLAVGLLLISTSIILINIKSKPSNFSEKDAVHEKRNKVLELSSRGYNEEQIARELGIGKNEARLIIRRSKSQ